MTDPKPDVAGARERLLADLKSRTRLIDDGPDGRGGFYSHTEPDALCQAAADEIKRQGEEIERLRGALTLALDYLGELEPGDSRAVSNEYVAMSAVLCGVEPNSPGEDMRIINAAIAARARQGGPDHG